MLVYSVECMYTVYQILQVFVTGVLPTFLADRFEFANDGSYIPLFSGCLVDDAYVGYSCFYCVLGSDAHFKELEAAS